jgi:hypothetical protein
MTGGADRVATFFDAVLKGQRPPRFPAEREDGYALLVAAAFGAATMGAVEPQPEFAARLSYQLAAAVGRS